MIQLYAATVGKDIAFISEEREHVARQVARKLGMKYARLKWVLLDLDELDYRNLIRSHVYRDNAFARRILRQAK